MDAQDDGGTVDVHIVLVPEQRIATDAVEEVVATRHGELTRLFPDIGDEAEDDDLRKYWLATVPATQADNMIHELLALPEIDGAYINPPASPA